MASIYRRNGTWYIYYTHGGERHRRSLETSNERVAKAELKKVEYELEFGLHRPPRQTPIDEFLRDFLAHLRSTTSFRHYRNRRSQLRDAFGTVIPELEFPSRRPGRKKRRSNGGEHRLHVSSMEDLTIAAIGRFLDDQARLRGWGPDTYNKRRETFHVMFEYAIRMYEYVSPDPRYHNPIKAIPRRKRPACDIRFLDLADIPEQLSALESEPLLRVAAAIMIYAGLRRAEVPWLGKGDIDLASRLIRIRPKRDGETCWEPKTKTNRVVPISGDLLEMLSAYESPPGSRWYVPAPKRKQARWDEDNLSRMLRRVNGEAGLPWTCLDFRHTFGSQLAMNNVSLYKIATLMGNSPDICRRHYAALIPEELTQCVEFRQRCGVG